MTLGTAWPVVQYVEDGGTLVHAIPFQFQAASEVVCTRIKDGVSTPCVLGSDYSVVRGDDGTGLLTKTSGGLAGTIFRIERHTDRAQPTDFLAHDVFPASAFEAGLDRVTAMVQENESGLSEAGTRSLRVPLGESAAELPAATDRKGKLLGFSPASGLRELLSYASLANLLLAPLTGLMGATIIKGDPGANTSAIGLFTAAATHLGGGGFSIPPGTDLVWTSGFSATGRGFAAYVRDAAVDAAFVAAHPYASFLATNGGAGFRLDATNGLNIQQTGAIPDCTAVGAGTDNYAAIMAAVAYGAKIAKCSELLVPKATLGYRVGATLVFTNGIKLRGQGYHENPGEVAGVPYTAPQGLPGSMLVFDLNVAGLRFIDFTDNLANAQAYEFEGSRYSIVEDLRLYGGGGANVAAHGIEIRTIVTLRNVSVLKFAGNGVFVNANTAGANPYGNASTCLFLNLKCLSNGCHGLHITGADANAISTLGGAFRGNGGAGYFDQSHVGGNKLDGSQFATNNESWGAGTAQTAKVQADSAHLTTHANGSIIIDNASVTPFLLGIVYIEGGNGQGAFIPAGSLVLGGLLAEDGYLIAGSAPMIFNSGANTITCDNYKTYGGNLNLLATSLALEGGQVVKVAGQQVLAGRSSGCPGAAVDLASVIALANHMRDKLLNAHGLLGV